jgi:tripartite-type tricarboxylate transporter receptor subunit TctC
MAEAGIAGGEASFGELLLAPKGTPANLVALLNQRIAAILQQPDIRERMLAVDLDFVPNTPQQASARLQRESVRWKDVVDRLGLKVQ